MGRYRVDWVVVPRVTVSNFVINILTPWYKLTLEEVHRVILSCASLKEAANELGWLEDKLASFLASYPHEKMLIDFHSLKALSAEEAYQTLGVLYKNRLQHLVLESYSLRQIHEEIIKKRTLSGVAKFFNVSEEAFLRHLNRGRYLGQAFDFETLHSLSILEAHLYFQESYDQPLHAISVDLNRCSFKYIHRAIRQSGFLLGAAKLLGLPEAVLRDRLENFFYRDVAIDVRWLLSQSEEKAAVFFGKNYEMPLLKSDIPCEEKKIEIAAGFSLSDIHLALLSQGSFLEAAKSLCVSPQLFFRYLIRYEGIYGGGIQYFNFAQLAKMSFSKATEIFGAFYDMTLWVEKINDLSLCALNVIHRAIIESDSVEEAAGWLGVTPSDLNNYLLRYDDGQIAFTYEVFRRLTFQAAADYFGERYDEFSLEKRKKIEDYTLKELHEIILFSETSVEAARCVGVYRWVFIAHLRAGGHQGDYFTFEMLKKIGVNTAQKIFGAYYDRVLMPIPVDFSVFTFGRIHKVVRNAVDLSEAANLLGVHSLILEQYFKQSVYVNEALTFQRLKRFSCVGAQRCFGWHYARPLLLQPINLDALLFSHLHQMCQLDTHKTLNSMALLLGLAPKILFDRVALIQYQDVPLTIEILSQISEETARQYEGYDKPLSQEKTYWMCVLALSFEREANTAVSSFKRSGRELGWLESPAQRTFSLPSAFFPNERPRIQEEDESNSVMVGVALNNSD